MPYSYYTKQTGSLYVAQWLSQYGHKMIPHVKSLRVDKHYACNYWEYLDGNVGKFSSMRSGGAFWQEYTPYHQYNGDVNYGANWSFGTEGSLAYARAYGKFKDKVYTQASNLTAISERAKTIDMVAARLKQLVKGASALKKGRFREFLGTFGIKPKPKHAHKAWSRPKDFGALWLEYWMGWAPTVGDVYTTLEFLGKPVPDSPVRAGATVPYIGYKRVAFNGSVSVSDWTGDVTVWLKAKVVVTNTSLFTMQGLGILNPAKTLWETTPFSWFFDWFTNIGQCLGQVTDWVGLQLKDLVVSCKTEATCSWGVTNAKNQLGSNADYYTYRKRKFVGFSRKCGGSLPIVKPIIRLPNGLSLSRGATAVSLLVTMFAPKKA